MVYHTEWIDPCQCHVPHITASVLINDAGLWAGCTTAPTKLGSGKPLSRKRRGNTADTNLQWNATRQVARDGLRRAAVVAVTNDRLDCGTWERVFYGEFDGRWRKRVLVKSCRHSFGIIGE